MAFQPKKVNIQIEFDPAPQGSAEEAEATTLAENLTSAINSEAQTALEGNLNNGGQTVTCHYEMIGGNWYLICK